VIFFFKIGLFLYAGLCPVTYKQQPKHDSNHQTFLEQWMWSWAKSFLWVHESKLKNTCPRSHNEQ